MSRKLTALALFVPSIALADPTSKVALVSNPFYEVVREAAEISGARLVGLTAFGATPSKRGEIDVAARIPSGWKGSPVCLKVVSADGLYESLNTYRVADDWAGGSSPLQYPSKNAEKVGAIPGELVSAILLRGDCASATDEAAPVFWGDEQYGALRLLLNTSRADETFLSFPAHDEFAEVACSPISLAARNAFDTACQLPEELGRLERVEAVALSFRNGEMGREEHMVLFPGGESGGDN